MYILLGNRFTSQRRLDLKGSYLDGKMQPRAFVYTALAD